MPHSLARLPLTWALALALCPAPAVAAKVKPAAAGDKSGGDVVTVKAGGLELQVPRAWEQKQPSSGMRLAEFRVPRVSGDPEDGELAVFHFGPGGGGGVQANLDRWIGQFDRKDVKVVLTQGKCKDGDYIFATITGTYNVPVGPPMGGQTRPMPNAQVLGVIVQNATGPYYLKLWGPRATVETAARPLRTAIGAQPNAKERPYP